MRLRENLKVSWRWKSAFPFILVVALAIGIRVLLSTLLDWRADFATGDSAPYLAAETSQSFRAPGYSVFVQSLGAGHQILLVQGILGLLGALAVWIAIKKTNRRLATFSAIAIAISPIPIPIPLELRILSETLYGFLVLISILIIFRSKSIPSMLSGGMVLGLAVLTRDSLLLLPLFILPFIPWRLGLVFLATVALVAGPWYVMHPGEGRGGFALWIGTWERDPKWQETHGFPGYAFRSETEKHELEIAIRRKDFSPYGPVAIERITTDPIGVIKTWTIRYPYLWLSTRTELTRLNGLELL